MICTHQKMMVSTEKKFWARARSPHQANVGINEELGQRLWVFQVICGLPSCESKLWSNPKVALGQQDTPTKKASGRRRNGTM